MVKSYSPSVTQRQIADRLRYWREAIAGISTQAEAATLANWKPSTQSRLESAKILIKPYHIATLGLALKIPSSEVERLFDKCQAEGQKAGWLKEIAQGVLHADFRDYVTLEALASKLRTFQIAYVPGMFQVEPYAVAAARVTSSDDLDDEALTQAVQARIHRQERLGKPEFEVHAIIAEHVLRSRCGGAITMRKQRRHLLEVAQLPGVELQILTPDAGAWPIGYGFSMLSFDEADPDVGYIEMVGRGVFIEDDSETDRYGRVFKRLQQMALEPEESIKWLAAIDSKEE